MPAVRIERNTCSVWKDPYSRPAWLFYADMRIVVRCDIRLHDAGPSGAF